MPAARKPRLVEAEHPLGPIRAASATATAAPARPRAGDDAVAVGGRAQGCAEIVPVTEIVTCPFGTGVPAAISTVVAAMKLNGVERFAVNV